MSKETAVAAGEPDGERILKPPARRVVDLAGASHGQVDIARVFGHAGRHAAKHRGRRPQPGRCRVPSYRVRLRHRPPLEKRLRRTASPCTSGGVGRWICPNPIVLTPHGNPGSAGSVPTTLPPLYDILAFGYYSGPSPLDSPNNGEFDDRRTD